MQHKYILYVTRGKKFKTAHAIIYDNVQSLKSIDIDRYNDT